MDGISSESTINNKWKLKALLARGAFCHVFSGYNKETNTKIAVKIVRGFDGGRHLNTEQYLYSYLEGANGFPKVYYYNNRGRYHVMVMELLGPSLADLFKICGYKFSPKTTILLADQMIERLKYVHLNSFIHRDIKPENFVIGYKDNPNTVYLIDFGLAKRYVDEFNNHVALKHGRHLCGTPRYLSIAAHLGYRTSRRDDMESLGYVLIFFITGELPWQNIQSINKQQKFEKIAECKMATPLEILCKNLPVEFLSYMKHVRELDFVQEPDYEYLQNLFRQLASNLGIQFDYSFDWTTSVNDRGSMITTERVSVVEPIASIEAVQPEQNKEKKKRRMSRETRESRGKN